eukprot:3090926-Pyramimonas_sp.AAC.1
MMFAGALLAIIRLGVLVSARLGSSFLPALPMSAWLVQFWVDAWLCFEVIQVVSGSPPLRGSRSMRPRRAEECGGCFCGGPPMGPTLHFRSSIRRVLERLPIKR